jgi:hypothetical protein
LPLSVIVTTLPLKVQPLPVDVEGLVIEIVPSACAGTLSASVSIIVKSIFNVFIALLLFTESIFGFQIK